MIQIITAQLIMHLIEPSVHRYLIRGDFHPDDSNGWHRAFVWQWIAVYVLAFTCYTVGARGFDLYLLLYMASSGLAMRFLAQSAVLNYWMIADKYPNRTWHQLRMSGSDLWISNKFRNLLRNTKYRHLMAEELDWVGMQKEAEILAIRSGFVILVIIILTQIL